MPKCYSCTHYRGGFCELNGTHSFTGEICSSYEDQYASAEKEITREELRTTKRSLWLVRAMNGYNTTHNETSYHNYMIEHPNTKVSMRMWFSCWNLVERKCRAKAEEYR